MPEPAAPVRFGIVLLPNFTLTALSGFIDMLRLSSDEGDNSRPVRCTWCVVGENLAPVRSSCGIQIAPWATFGDADEYDYVVVVGGLLHSGSTTSEAILSYLHTVGQTRATLVGVCTGVFALMRAGVLKDHRVCISWFHYWDFLERFPAADENLIVSERLYVIDRRRVTCSGGRASIDVAAAILVRHIDAGVVKKALRILQVDESARFDAPQPQPAGLAPTTHPKVKRAVLLMEQHLSQPLSMEALSAKVGVSVRQLQRLFKESLGASPQIYARQIRLRMAKWLLLHTGRPISSIASGAGFADASHMGREFRRTFGVSPGAYREHHGVVAPLAPAPAPRADMQDEDYGECYPDRERFF
ncbi:GlxA family transcriptional regulator [Castellaniella sp. GW247-6E4]|uniref:GlxA family transcriptional regulator n=1 Tax=Castellaniella sp. GW247-6E4 TaxID=3140380 RepID=UPI0033159950